MVQAGLPPRAGQIVPAKSAVMCGVIFRTLPDGSKTTWPARTRTSLPLASRRSKTSPTCLDVPSGYTVKSNWSLSVSVYPVSTFTWVTS